MKGLLALPFALAAFLSGAHAEIIQRLAGGAACRTAEGLVRAPRVAPKPGVAAHRAVNGMIATDQPVEGAACYLFAAEARLGAEPCPPVSASCAGTLGVPTSPSAAPKLSPATLRIIDNGYEFLYTQGAEKPGFGLYTYVLLTPASPERAKALLDAILASTPRVTAFGGDIAHIDVIYIPSTGGGAAPPRANSGEVIARYDFDLARALIEAICEMPAEEVFRICRTGLGAGPYLFSYASPVRKDAKVSPPVLFVDLTPIEKDTFPTFVEAYKQQIKSDDISDGQKINSLSIRILNIIETAKVFVDPVEHAVGDVIHLVTSDGQNGKAH
jgi:hypothetical protein